MASAYLGPESPRPLSVISETYRGHVHCRLPKLAEWERFSLGSEYEEQFFLLLHKYLELDTTDRLCYVGDTRDGIAQKIEQKFCLAEPVRTLVPGHMHYAETTDHKMVPIAISHVGAEEHFRQLVEQRAKGEGSAREGSFSKILLHDGCRYMTDPPTMYSNMVKCLSPGGILLIVHRPANLSTLPFFKDAHSRLADSDVAYMEIVKDLQGVNLDVQWQLETVPVRMSKRKWLAMIRDRYPPQMQIMSDTQVLAGLRELTEGILKYEGDQVEFKDRLLFIKAVHSKLENGYPSIKRYTNGQFEPFPMQSELKLTMELPVDLPHSKSGQDARNGNKRYKFLWN